MRNTVLLLINLFFLPFVIISAQNSLNFHQANGIVRNADLNDIDSVSFLYNGTVAEFCFSSLVRVDYSISLLDSLTFLNNLANTEPFQSAYSRDVCFSASDDTLYNQHDEYIVDDIEDEEFNDFVEHYPVANTITITYTKHISIAINI